MDPQHHTVAPSDRKLRRRSQQPPGKNRPSLRGSGETLPEGTRPASEAAPALRGAGMTTKFQKQQSRPRKRSRSPGGPAKQRSAEASASAAKRRYQGRTTASRRPAKLRYGQIVPSKASREVFAPVGEQLKRLHATSSTKYPYHTNLPLDFREGAFELALRLLVLQKEQCKYNKEYMDLFNGMLPELVTTTARLVQLSCGTTTCVDLATKLLSELPADTQFVAQHLIAWACASAAAKYVGICNVGGMLCTTKRASDITRAAWHGDGLPTNMAVRIEIGMLAAMQFKLAVPCDSQLLEAVMEHLELPGEVRRSARYAICCMAQCQSAYVQFDSCQRVRVCVQVACDASRCCVPGDLLDVACGTTETWTAHQFKTCFALAVLESGAPCKRDGEVAIAWLFAECPDARILAAHSRVLCHMFERDKQPDVLTVPEAPYDKQVIEARMWAYQCIDDSERRVELARHVAVRLLPFCLRTDQPGVKQGPRHTQPGFVPVDLAQGPLLTNDADRLCKCVLSGLAQAHAVGITHGSLSRANRVFEFNLGKSSSAAIVWNGASCPSFVRYGKQASNDDGWIVATAIDLAEYRNLAFAMGASRRVLCLCTAKQMMATSCKDLAKHGDVMRAVQAELQRKKPITLSSLPAKASSSSYEQQPAAQTDRLSPQEIVELALKQVCSEFCAIGSGGSHS